MRSWPRGLAKCDESKHDEDAFHLAAADLNYYGPKSLWQTSQIIVGSEYYTSITRRVGLNRIQWCVGSGVNIRYILLIQDGGAQVHHVLWNNYVDIEQQVLQVIFIIFLSTWGYNSLGNTTRQHKVWKKILLQADPIERLTACVLAANTKFDAKMTKMKWNYMVNIIMKYQEQFVKLSR